jgi:hypothetical protein
MAEFSGTLVPICVWQPWQTFYHDCDDWDLSDGCLNSARFVVVSDVYGVGERRRAQENSDMLGGVGHEMRLLRSDPPPPLESMLTLSSGPNWLGVDVEDTLAFFIA